MKKNNNRKGFTIVELVIVIAVIAILASVMIPTFSGVIDKANASAAQQKAVAIWKDTYAKDLADGKLDAKDNGTDIAVESGVYYHPITKNSDGFLFSIVVDGYTVKYDGVKWVATKN